MPAKISKTKDEINNIRNLISFLCMEGYSVSQMAKESGCSKSNIYYHLKRLNLQEIPRMLRIWNEIEALETSSKTLIEQMDRLMAQREIASSTKIIERKITKNNKTGTIKTWEWRNTTKEELLEKVLPIYSMVNRLIMRQASLISEYRKLERRRRTKKQQEEIDIDRAKRIICRMARHIQNNAEPRKKKTEYDPKPIVTSIFPIEAAPETAPFLDIKNHDRKAARGGE